MAESGVRTRHLWFPNRGDIWHMYYARHQLLCRRFCASWAKSVIGKKTPTIELNIFFSKIFFRWSIKKWWPWTLLKPTELNRSFIPSARFMKQYRRGYFEQARWHARWVLLNNWMIGFYSTGYRHFNRQWSNGQQSGSSVRNLFYALTMQLIHFSVMKSVNVQE